MTRPTRLTIKMPPDLSDAEIDRLDSLAEQAYSAGYVNGRADGGRLILDAVAARAQEIVAAVLEAERGKPRLRKIIRDAKNQIVAIEEPS